MVFFSFVLEGLERGDEGAGFCWEGAGSADEGAGFKQIGGSSTSANGDTSGNSDT